MQKQRGKCDIIFGANREIKVILNWVMGQLNIRNWLKAASGLSCVLLWCQELNRSCQGLWDLVLSIWAHIWGKEEAWALAFHKPHGCSKCSYCALWALLGEAGMWRDCDGQFLYLHSVIDYLSPRSKFILNFTSSSPCLSSSSSVVKFLYSFYGWIHLLLETYCSREPLNIFCNLYL